MSTYFTLFCVLFNIVCPPQVMEKKGKQNVEKVLLNEVTARAQHGQVLAIAGPSGSSKTTFLDAIAGRIQRQSLEGSVLVNGVPWDASFMKVSQYVMQDDALFPMLTTRETLLFSAKFRLPSSMSYAEKLKRVEVIIQQLGLKGCADTYVGDELVRSANHAALILRASCHLLAASLWQMRPAFYSSCLADERWSGTQKAWGP